MTRAGFLVALIAAAPALASEDIADKYPQSVLYDKPMQVTASV